MSVARIADRESDKLAFGYRAIWPLDLRLPESAEAPSMRVEYDRSTDTWKIVSRDGRILDQLADREEAERVLALMMRRPAPAAEPEAPTAMQVAMLAARPLQRPKPKRGRPRKAAARSADADAAPMAAAPEG